MPELVAVVAQQLAPALVSAPKSTCHGADRGVGRTALARIPPIAPPTAPMAAPRPAPLIT
jgi:hypothetical protein